MEKPLPYRNTSAFKKLPTIVPNTKTIRIYNGNITTKLYIKNKNHA